MESLKEIKSVFVIKITQIQKNSNIDRIEQMRKNKPFEKLL